MCNCYICKRDVPEDEGGLNSTGDIQDPIWRWICNRCLLDFVCP